MKKILVAYYTQTGQLKDIIDSVLSPLQEEDYKIDFLKIEPETPYEFPWTADKFFDAFPESVSGIPCKLKDIEFPDNNYDLVILGYQVWYLSPSIPFWSFLQDEKTKQFLQSKNVITILGVRNMWVNAHLKIRKYFDKHNVNHIGNIVFDDPNNNLVSVITVIKWMMAGNQGPSGIWPKSGVPDKNITQASKFGYLIDKHFSENSMNELQTDIAENDGVPVKFDIKTMELNAFRIFKIWTKFISKKGGPGDPSRLFRVRAFKYYLITLIFLISPIASLVFSIIRIVFYPFTQKGIKRLKYNY